VIGRGANYATAFEAALKIKELAGVAAEPASPADFLHGPVAMLEPGFPVLAILPSGPAGAAVRDVIAAASTSTDPWASRRSRARLRRSMPPIRIQGLTKRYKDGPLAVDHVDLDIRDGEFMVLVGPSGCGKSTMLQMLAGIVEVSEGSIHIGDKDVTRLDPRKRDIAMVFQSYALYPHHSVRGNLGFGLKLRGAGKGDIARRVDEVARIPGHVEVVEELGTETQLVVGIDAPRLRAEAVRDALDAAPGDDVLLADEDRATLTAVLLADEDRATLTAVVEPRSRVATGTAVELAIDPARLHAFDPATGAAIARDGVPDAEHALA
jgi:ABC-type taurine transport system ATPase subunit